MSLKLAINTITIKQAPLLDKIRIAAQVGYQGIGLWIYEIREFIDQGKSISELSKILKAHNLEVPEICAVGGWHYTSGEAKRKALEEAERVFEMAQALEAGCIIAPVSGEVGDISSGVKDFTELCQLGANYNANLALEFLGMAKQVKDVRTGWEIVKEANCDNGGIVVDTFHFYKGDSKIEDLKEVWATKILLIHINDCLDLPKDVLQDTHRVFPGKGIIPLKKIISTLKGNGYEGYYSLEIFNEEYWKADPLWVAKEGKRSLEAVFAK